MAIPFTIQLRSAQPGERETWKRRLPSWKAITRGREKILTVGDPARMAWVLEDGAAWIWAESDDLLHDPAAHRALAVVAPRPLLFWGWMEPGSRLDNTLAAAGWRAVGEQTLYEMELEKMRLSKVDRLTTRFLNGRSLPPAISLNPMSLETDTADVLAFVFRVMPDSRLPVMDRLRAGGVAGFSSHLSQVLRLNGEVRGIILCTWKGEVAEADLVAVDHGLRGGWANLLLKHSVVTPMRSMGVRFVRYWVNPALNADAVKAAILAEARIIQRLHCRELGESVEGHDS